MADFSLFSNANHSMFFSSMHVIVHLMLSINQEEEEEEEDEEEEKNQEEEVKEEEKKDKEKKKNCRKGRKRSKRH